MVASCEAPYPRGGHNLYLLHIEKVSYPVPHEELPLMLVEVRAAIPLLQPLYILANNSSCSHH